MSEELYSSFARANNCFWHKADIDVLQFSALGEGQKPERACRYARGGRGLGAIGERTRRDPVTLQAHKK